MISRKVLRGICKNCANGLSCTFLDGRRRRVFQCDEFVALTKGEVQQPWVNPAVGDEECSAVLLNGRRGLCSSCGRWEECGFPHAEGGVWHCEEYC